jgi:hypothetical protein
MRSMLAILGVAAATLVAGPALACSCLCNVEQLIEGTPLFFVGKPMSQKRAGTRFHYQVEVVSTIRGKLPKRVVVSTPSGGGACAVHFELGKETLIGARRGADGYTTNLCVDLCVKRHSAEIEKLKAR